MSVFKTELMSSGKQTGRQLNPERLICRISRMMLIYGTAGKRHHRVWIPSKLCFQAGFSPRIMRLKLQHKGRASANMEPNRTTLCFYWEPSSGNSGTTGVSAETGAAGEECGNLLPSMCFLTAGTQDAIVPSAKPESNKTRPPLEGRGHAALYNHNRKKPAAWP